MKSIPIRYCFTFTDRTQEIINLRLNPKTLELANDRPGYLPSWTDARVSPVPQLSSLS
ncbi:MAG: hypothetical protein ACOX2W_08710 [Desulfomonilia bacterium]